MTALERLAELADIEWRRRAAEMNEAAVRVYVEGGIIRVTGDGDLAVIDPADFYVSPPRPL